MAPRRCGRPGEGANPDGFAALATMPAKVGFVVSLLERNGWLLVRQRGSHRQYKHPDNPYVVSVAGKRSEQVPTGTLADIRRKTGLKELR